MGAFLSRITMSAVVGALVAGGLIYLNMRQGMDGLAAQSAATATAEALEVARAENAAILGGLENDMADLAAEIMAIKQILAAQAVHNAEQRAEFALALDAIASRLELPLNTTPAPELIAPTE